MGEGTEAKPLTPFLVSQSTSGGPAPRPKPTHRLALTVCQQPLTTCDSPLSSCFSGRIHA